MSQPTSFIYPACSARVIPGNEPHVSTVLNSLVMTGSQSFRDFLLTHSAKVIPGNEPRVSSMLNSLAMTGARVVQSRDLHTSGTPVFALSDICACLA